MEKAMSQMISLDDFQELMRRVDEARRQRDQDLGAIKQRRSHLRETYGVADLEEAKELREKKRKVMQRRAAAYLEAKKKFEAALARRPIKPEG
jgi:predicted Zn-dependent protease